MRLEHRCATFLANSPYWQRHRRHLQGACALILTMLLFGRWAPLSIAFAGPVQLANTSAAAPPRTIALNGPTVLRQQTPPGQTAAQQGEILFQADYRSDLNGFQFRNYGATHPEGDMTVVEARTLFGDGVCAQLNGDRCIPTPAADLWIAAKNKTMAAGHCIGFTVMSYRLLAGELAVDQFAPQAAMPFDLTQDIDTMRHIAQSYAMYYIPGMYKGNVVKGTPIELVEALLALKEPVDLGIFANDGAGHSMLGYGVRQTAAGLYEILVYDNNHPGTEMAVLVDPVANTWSYQEGAVSPGDTTKRTWAGSAKTAGTYQGDMEFIPLSAYTESERRCPKQLCGESTSSGSTGADRGSLLISYDGEGDLLVTNAQGALSGRIFGRYVNDIPDGALTPTRGTRVGDSSPLIEVPASEDVVAHLFAAYNQRANLQFFGPDFAMTLDGLTVNRNQSEEVRFSATKAVVDYIATSTQDPTFKIANDNYLLILGDLTMPSSGALELSIDPETSNVRAAGQKLIDERFTMILVQLSGEQVNIFASDEVALPAVGNVRLEVADWDGRGPLTVAVDENNDGVTTPVALTNKPLGELIQNAQSGQEIVELVGDLPAYMSPAAVDAFLASVVQLPLSGYDLGGVTLAFPRTDSELLSLIAAAGLRNDLSNLAQFLYAQHWERAALARFTEQLNLLPAELTTLQSDLDKMAVVRAGVLEWDFYNPDDKLAAMPEFMDRYNFDAQQAFVFLRTQGTVVPADQGAILATLAMDPTEKMEAQSALGIASPAEACNCGIAPVDLRVDLKRATAVAPAPTAALPPTAIPTPIATSAPNVGQVNRNANLRSGPSTVYPVVETLRQGEIVTVSGINAAGDWYQLDDGAWIAVFLVDGVTATVPTVAAPSLPPTPTAPPAAPTVENTPQAPSTPAATPETGTAPATATDGSVIAFQASRPQIKQCECTQLSWHAEGVRAVYYQGGGQAGIASRIECPPATTTYTLQVFKLDGSEEVKQVTVDVIPDAACIAPTPTPPPPAREDNNNDNNDNNDNNENNDNDSNSNNDNDDSYYDSYPEDPDYYSNDNDDGN